MRALLFAAVGAAGLTLGTATTASAHPPGAQIPGYFGNGPHDLQPHWHQTYTPYGPITWYGNGPHDLMPHGHTMSPWGGTRSYSFTPFGPTTSYNGFPGGFGGYYGGRGYGGGGFGTYPGYGGYRPW